MPKKRFRPKELKDQDRWSREGWREGRHEGDAETGTSPGGEGRGRQRRSANVEAPSANADQEIATRQGVLEGPATAETELAEPGLEHQGLVINTWSGGCRVRSAAGDHDCVLPSALAAQQKSALAVGDQVRCVGDETPSAPWRLIEVLPRTTRLARPHPLNPRIERVIAANVTRVVQVSSVAKPALRLALIDRYLIAIEQSGAAPILCINKVDLIDADELEALEAELAPYRELGLPIVFCSAQTGLGIAELRALLAGHLTVVVGHSGVGKSSLLNALAPDFAARTAAISQAWQKGRHTTTQATLYESADGIRLIDTPGIRELGLLDLDRETLRAFFPDLEELAEGCRFSDCRHLQEPACAVREAAEENRAIRARLATFLRISASLEESR